MLCMKALLTQIKEGTWQVPHIHRTYFILKLQATVKILICSKVLMSDDIMSDSIKEQSNII